MANRDALGDRMKLYEGLAESRLMPRVPVLIRIDGKAFHTLTKGMTKGMGKPFDHRLMRCMEMAAKFACQHMQGAQMAYVQSDEISILLTDWDSYDTQPWFGYRVQKVASVASSLATLGFNRAFDNLFFGSKFISRMATFDARVWNVPRHDVGNYFIWRQQDWQRNSVHMAGRAFFSAKQLHRKSGLMVRDMLREAGHPWEDLTVQERNGFVYHRNLEESGWEADHEPPVFSEGREYIERFLPDVFWKERKPDGHSSGWRRPRTERSSSWMASKPNVSISSE